MPEACWRAAWTVASSSARHGWLRRNAVSPHGVRLGGAPGAPLWIGCSSANRALAGKLLWDGIVAVPEVHGAGCLALSPVRRVRAARPSGRFPTHPPWLADTRRRTEERRALRKSRKISRQTKQRASTLASRGCCAGSTGLAGSPGGRESWKDH